VAPASAGLTRPYVQDSIVALVLAALAFLPGFTGNGILLGELHLRSLDGPGVALGLLQCLPLVEGSLLTVILGLVISWLFLRRATIIPRRRRPAVALSPDTKSDSAPSHR
jgi:hypothetical protein